MKKILICNGSLGAESGNTQHIIERLRAFITEKKAFCEVLHLKTLPTMDILKEKLQSADAFIFTSGTYWDSWGSPMQSFLETATEFEASDIFMGKPAAVIITMHSVGGKGVLSRLQGVLNSLGMGLPPMSGMVYSLAGQLALESHTSFDDDFWSMDDVDVVAHNLLTGLNGNSNYLPWPVDDKDPKRIWIK